MSDDPFLQAILNAPRDNSVRLVYADWLEERGDSRSDFLRVEVALESLAAGDPHRGELVAQLREASVGIDRGWVAAISRIPIENCEISFQFRCPKRWESLKSTADDTVRFCDACQKQVFFCSGLEVAQTPAALGDCIAIDPMLVRHARDLESNIWDMDLMMGLPVEDQSPDKDAGVPLQRGR